MPFLPIVSDAQTGVRLLRNLEIKKPRINPEYFGLVKRIASGLFFCIFLFTIPGRTQSPDQANSENSPHSSAAAVGADVVMCREIPAIPIALAPGQPTSDTISGELCEQRCSF